MMTLSPHDLYFYWAIQCATMIATIRSNEVIQSKSKKTIPSSDCFLQVESMK